MSLLYPDTQVAFSRLLSCVKIKRRNIFCLAKIRLENPPENSEKRTGKSTCTYFTTPKKYEMSTGARFYYFADSLHCGKISEFYSSEISKPSFFSGYYLGQHVMKLLHCGDSKTWQVDLLITPKSLIGGL